jgi:hypothetical protein
MTFMEERERCYSFILSRTPQETEIQTSIISMCNIQRSERHIQRVYKNRHTEDATFKFQSGSYYARRGCMKMRILHMHGDADERLRLIVVRRCDNRENLRAGIYDTSHSM